MHFVCNTLKINDRIFRGKIGAVGGRFEARFLPLVAVSLPFFYATPCFLGVGTPRVRSSECVQSHSFTLPCLVASGFLTCARAHLSLR